VQAQEGRVVYHPAFGRIVAEAFRLDEIVVGLQQNAKKYHSVHYTSLSAEICAVGWCYDFH
jgi:hypothetical protein